MKKYLFLIYLSIQNQLTYRLNFFLQRIRSVFQLMVVYFLWAAAYGTSNSLFGYSQAQMFTYVVGVSLLRSYIMSGKLSQGVGEKIVTGELSNIIIRPLSFFKYILSLDIGNTLINLLFSAVEISVFLWLFKSPLFIQTNYFYIFATVIFFVLGFMIYFLIGTSLSLSAFWIEQDWWAPIFLLGTIIEFASGGIFPIDILPKAISTIIFATPFPYILYFPVKVYLGQVSTDKIIQGMLITAIWILVLSLIYKIIWKKGLRIYEAYGK